MYNIFWLIFTFCDKTSIFFLLYLPLFTEILIYVYKYISCIQLQFWCAKCANVLGEEQGEEGGGHFVPYWPCQYSSPVHVQRIPLKTKICTVLEKKPKLLVESPSRNILLLLSYIPVYILWVVYYLPIPPPLEKSEFVLIRGEG